jgi:hypothetical protein
MDTSRRSCEAPEEENTGAAARESGASDDCCRQLFIS